MPSARPNPIRSWLNGNGVLTPLFLGGLFRGSDEVSAGLFPTKLYCYELTQPIDTVLNGGLRTSAPESDGRSHGPIVR